MPKSFQFLRGVSGSSRHLWLCQVWWSSGEEGELAGSALLWILELGVLNSARTAGFVWVPLSQFIASGQFSKGNFRTCLIYLVFLLGLPSCALCCSISESRCLEILFSWLVAYGGKKLPVVVNSSWAKDDVPPRSSTLLVGGDAEADQFHCWKGKTLLLHVISILW